jgi:phenylacetate-coenzyme A ligase PaaK-like adenylate-forming protein
MVQEHGLCTVYTFATSAVRVCMAASENGLNIKGVRFLVTGEPLTSHKKAEIEAAGARAIPVYGISEAGVIAAGCDRPSPISDDCHLFKDTTAVISHEHRVEHFDTTVNSFLFTSLLYEAPKLLLNVGMGDYGVVEEKPCDCAFGKLGFHTRISCIRSYEKLTGEGVTFVDTDFIRIIEKDLPDRFGGASTDYQLIEEEDAKGIGHLHLIVSPRLNGIEEDAIIETFIGLLSSSEASPESWAQSGTVMWNQARTLRVKREFPIATVSGKILPFHLVRRQTPAQTIA